MKYTGDKKNQGFSLIELIIAIAILVILTGLLAPKMIRYIEKAREAKMLHAFDELSAGFKFFWSDPDNSYTEAIKNMPTVYINYRVGDGQGTSSSDEFDKYAEKYFHKLFGKEMDNYIGEIYLNKKGLVEAEGWFYFPKGRSKDYYYFYHHDWRTGIKELKGPFKDAGWKPGGGKPKLKSPL